MRFRKIKDSTQSRKDAEKCSLNLWVWGSSSAGEGRLTSSPPSLKFGEGAGG